MSKILLVDDSKSVRASLQLILESAGFEVAVACDGREGMKSAATQKFDLVLTDVLMPEADGTELMMYLRTHEINIPVIAMSAGGRGVRADEALAIVKHFATDVLEKPFSRTELLSRVNTLLAG